jgi:TrpR-related protein YerC/YecD
MHHPQSPEGEHLALFEAILSLKTVSEAAEFFSDLCTPAELQDMADRWQVLLPLTQDIPYRKIYEMTGVSVTTIGRVARSLKYGTGGYNLILKRVLSKKHARNQINYRSTKKRAVK